MKNVVTTRGIRFADRRDGDHEGERHAAIVSIRKGECHYSQPRVSWRSTRQTK